MEAGATLGSGGDVVDISTERTMGLIGSILALAGIIPRVGGLLSLIGFVLILIALHGIGNKLNDGRPFNYYLKAIIAIFVALIVGVVVMAAAFVVSSGSTSSIENEFIMSPGSEITIIEEESPHLTGEGIALLVIGAGIILAGIIVGGYFQKKAWESMYKLTGVEAFQNTAKFLWWGVLTIVILIGAILLLISEIYQIIAFANLPEKLTKRPETHLKPPIDDFEW
ncbi:hypothetical protein X802_07005 [Thermococcus guaymasensis DSM 11113]|uniref:DUF996 domain-containing protein n=1 Tax=Thermococcus guaymasensis DSM 11113 TaxID=1432656 RepID=A0A0X1KL24_9EURY|nr:DUF996 domain-containing protein [Thermococcus guaymasensis]AJC71930.1 hypothetical protein X802_07005 [Thermococcus guaymasensis DSM 11113]